MRPSGWMEDTNVNRDIEKLFHSWQWDVWQYPVKEMSFFLFHFMSMRSSWKKQI